MRKKKALEKFDSSEIQSTLADSVSSDEMISKNHLVTIDKEHPEFYKVINYEIKRALEKFDSSEIQNE